MTHWQRFIIHLSASICVLYMLTFELTESADSCEICQDIVKGFQHELTKTANSNFGGGNTDWEKKLGSFATSETRLVHIVEKVCETTSDEKKCHSMVEEQEENIENWWFKEYKNNQQADLYEYLCVESLKICCPDNTYGPECQPCKALVDGKACTGHGKCSGNGTRSGDGSCQCEMGYSGDVCDKCSDSYFSVGENTSSNWKCESCHSGCEGGCIGASAMQCNSCRSGWIWNDETGCIDINECEETADSEPRCKEDNQYCVNTQGSFRCDSCDSACSGCTGSGPGNCTNCQSGYEMKEDGECEDVNECSADSTLCRGDHEACHNTPGSYKCECAAGYQRDSTDICVKIATSQKESSDDTEDLNDEKDEL